MTLQNHIVTPLRVPNPQVENHCISSLVSQCDETYQDGNPVVVEARGCVLKGLHSPREEKECKDSWEGKNESNSQTYFSTTERLSSSKSNVGSTQTKDGMNGENSSRLTHKPHNEEFAQEQKEICHFVQDSYPVKSERISHDSNKKIKSHSCKLNTHFKCVI